MAAVPMPQCGRFIHQEESMLDPLSCRERLKRTFLCQPTDRMPVRIWGVDPMFPSDRRGWDVLYQLVERHELDIIRNWGPSAEEQDPPLIQSRSETRESDKPNMREVVTTLETPAGGLTQVTYQPAGGRPGYVKKHFLESVCDARKWLSIPLAKTNAGVESSLELDRRTGDRALLMVGLAEAMYSIQAMIGSEVFGFWLVDERDLLHELVDRAYQGIEDSVKHYLSCGVGDAYGWVGPELCLPPLASPRDFREFVFDYDKRICDLIHDASKLVWVHCHGDMSLVLEDFIEMGVDCLNPIEPPPCGKLTLAAAKAVVQGRMALDGGVQDGAFDLLPPGAMVPVVEDAVRQLKPGGGFVLCPTSSPTTWPELSDQHLRHYRDFVETGVRLAAYD